MDDNRQMWQVWAQNLHRWGMRDFVATLLEAAGPLTILGAQAIYLGQPFVDGLPARSQLKALAGLLEDTNQTKAFIDFLREANPQ